MFTSTGLTAFVPTSDLAVADAFYGDTLGLRRIETSPFANVYDVDGTQLRVTLVEVVDPQPHTVLGWNVADIGAAVQDLGAAGLELHRYEGMGQDDRGVWSAPSGAQIVWFQDPDGNVLSAHQLP